MDSQTGACVYLALKTSPQLLPIDMSVCSEADFMADETLSAMICQRWDIILHNRKIVLARWLSNSRAPVCFTRCRERIMRLEFTKAQAGSLALFASASYPQELSRYVHPYNITLLHRRPNLLPHASHTHISDHLRSYNLWSQKMIYYLNPKNNIEFIAI